MFIVLFGSVSRYFICVNRLFGDANRLMRTSSKLPAQASRFVRKPGRLNRFFAVASMLVWSNCDVFVGPFRGDCMTLPFATHGDISMDEERTPRRLKSKGEGQDVGPSFGSWCCAWKGVYRHGEGVCTDTESKGVHRIKRKGYTTSIISVQCD